MWAQWPKTERDKYKTQSKLGQLLSTLYVGSKADTDVKRWLPLLQNDRIFEQCERFTETQWGRHKFSLRIVSDSLTCRLDFVSDLL